MRALVAQFLRDNSLVLSRPVNKNKHSQVAEFEQQNCCATTHTLVEHLFYVRSSFFIEPFSLHPGHA